MNNAPRQARPSNSDIGRSVDASEREAFADRQRGDTSRISNCPAAACALCAEPLRDAKNPVDRTGAGTPRCRGSSDRNRTEDLAKHQKTWVGTLDPPWHEIVTAKLPLARQGGLGRTGVAAVVAQTRALAERRRQSSVEVRIGRTRSGDRYRPARRRAPRSSITDLGHQLSFTLRWKAEMSEAAFTGRRRDRGLSFIFGRHTADAGARAIIADYIPAKINLERFIRDPGRRNQFKDLYSRY